MKLKFVIGMPLNLEITCLSQKTIIRFMIIPTGIEKLIFLYKGLTSQPSSAKMYSIEHFCTKDQFQSSRTKLSLSQIASPSIKNIMVKPKRLEYLLATKGSLHCVKSVCTRSYSAQYFPALGLNTERYEASLCTQSKSGKIGTRITLKYFLCSKGSVLSDCNLQFTNGCLFPWT